MLVEKGGEVIPRRGYGMAHLELGVPIAPDMVFRLGSITKQFTAAAILLLVEEGKLALDDTVGGRLAGYSGPAAPVTLRQLLTHTGGVPSYTDVPEYPDEEIFVAVLSNSPAADPGALALDAATRVLGKPLAERPSVALDAGTLDGYVGVYSIEGPGDQTRVITREGSGLVSLRTGGAKSPMSFSEEDRFFYAESLTTGRFERDPAGRVTGMWMRPALGPEEHAAKTDRPIPAERQEAEIDPAVLDRYPGRYQLAPGFWIGPESETRFFYRVVDAQIEFHGGEDGRADSLTLFQSGREMPGERVED